MMSHKKNKKFGFTLIELLVVISIIGLLSTFAIIGLDNARKKARDARRKSDLAALKTAIELYYNDKGTFPDNAATNLGYWSNSYNSQLSPYIPKLPIDPLSNDSGRFYGSYRMTWAPDQNCNGKYVLWAYLETSDPLADTCGFGGVHYFKVMENY